MHTSWQLAIYSKTLDTTYSAARLKSTSNFAAAIKKIAHCLAVVFLSRPTLNGTVGCFTVHCESQRLPFTATKDVAEGCDNPCLSVN